MKIDVININGTSAGKKAELADDIFAIEPNQHVMYLAVKQYLANQRQGTHKSKERGEVAGSTKKLHRQKGTGGSRKGSIKNPLYGNGTVFGPRVRDYSFKLNKKVKSLATKSAISVKGKENNIMVVEDFDFNEPKTKQYTKALESLKVSGLKSIIVLSDVPANVGLSSRNIPNSKTVKAVDLNIYDILNCDKLILSEGSIEVLTERLK